MTYILQSLKNIYIRISRTKYFGGLLILGDEKKIRFFRRFRPFWATFSSTFLDERRNVKKARSFAVNELVLVRERVIRDRVRHALLLNINEMFEMRLAVHILNATLTCELVIRGRFFTKC